MTAKAPQKPPNGKRPKPPPPPPPPPPRVSASERDQVLCSRADYLAGIRAAGGSDAWGGFPPSPNPSGDPPYRCATMPVFDGAENPIRTAADACVAANEFWAEQREWFLEMAIKAINHAASHGAYDCRLQKLSPVIVSFLEEELSKLGFQTEVAYFTERSDDNLFEIRWRGK